MYSIEFSLYDSAMINLWASLAMYPRGYPACPRASALTSMQKYKMPDDRFLLMK